MIERSDNAAGSMGRHGQVASDAAAKWQGAFAAARPLSSRRQPLEEVLYQRPRYPIMLITRHRLQAPRKKKL